MTTDRVRKLITVALLTSCTTPPSDSGLTAPRNGASPAETRTLSPTIPTSDAWFADYTEIAGLNFVHFNGMSGEYYAPEVIPAGVGLFDYDNDGDLDAYFVQGQMMGTDKTLDDALFTPVGPLPLRSQLYRNDLRLDDDGTRSLRFTDVTTESGLDVQGHGMGIATGDIDNDGWVDLYLTNLGPNRLFHNNGDGTFTDISVSSGTADPGWGVSASFVDIDRDGWLDLYVGNYLTYDFNLDPGCTGLAGRRIYCGPLSFMPQEDRLYHNQRDGTFADVTATTLNTSPLGPALGVSTADFNDDGWMDIYVANDQADNFVWMNHGDGHFSDTGRLSGAAVSADGQAEASMGVDAGDFDNDGDEDLIMTHLPDEGSNLYVNDGQGAFQDLSASSGLHRASLGYTGWGTAWIDFDNDGWLDILAVNGAIDAVLGDRDDPLPFQERNLLLRNTRDGRFENVTDQAGNVFDYLNISRGAAFGDIDNDGDTDVLVSNLNAPARLLINTIGNQSHWIGLRLVGSDGRDMYGSQVKVMQSGEQPRWRRAHSDGSYASANDPRVLLGLGSSSSPLDVQVRWPSGNVEVWTVAEVNHWTTLTEGLGRTE